MATPPQIPHAQNLREVLFTTSYLKNTLSPVIASSGYALLATPHDLLQQITVGAGVTGSRF